MERFGFSLATMLLLTAIVALTIALVYSQSKVLQLTKELKNVVPLREVEVFAQIERQTAVAKMPVSVTSSTCTGSTYLIGFDYFDPATSVLGLYELIAPRAAHVCRFCVALRAMKHDAVYPSAYADGRFCVALRAI